MPNHDFDHFVQLCKTTAEVDEVELDERRLEPHLLRVLEFLKAHPEIRPQASRHLVEGLDRPGTTAPHLLDFCMRELQWPEVRQAVVEMIERERDPSRKIGLQQILQVYGPKWGDAVLYNYYAAEATDNPPMQRTGRRGILSFVRRLWAGH